MQAEQPGTGEDGQGAQAAPEPFAASAHPPAGDAEAGSGLTAAVTCVFAAALAFVLPILAMQLIQGPPPVVEDHPEAPLMQSVGRQVAVRPAYRVHIVPDVHFPASSHTVTCEPQD